MKEQTFTGWVCDDCMFAHAYGGLLRDDEPDKETWCLLSDGASVAMGMPWEEHSCENAVDVDPWAGPVECDCERVEFSWNACEGCGDQLGGARNAFTFWFDESN